MHKPQIIKHGVITLALPFLLCSCLETIPLKTSPTQANAATTTQANASNATDRPITLLASTAVDKGCKAMVISTTLTENVVGLGYLAMDLAKVKGLEALGNSVNASSASVSQLDSSKLKEILWAYSKNYVWLPMNLEQMYGDKEHDELSYLVMARSDKNKKLYSYADGMMKEILSAVDQPNDYKFQLFILKRSGQNALSLAGGRIYLDEKLVKDTKLHDQAIFAMSHEISHILQRHETKHIQTRIMDSIDLLDTVKNIKSIQSGGSEAQVIFGGLLAGKQLFTMNYMDQELQADSCGYKLTAKVMNGDKVRINKTVNDFIYRLSNAEVAKNSKQLVTSHDLIKNKDANQKSLENLINIKDIIFSPIAKHPSSEDRRNNLRTLATSQI